MSLSAEPDRTEFGGIFLPRAKEATTFLSPSDRKILDLFSVFRLNKCVDLVIFEPFLLPRRMNKVYMKGGGKGKYQITKLYKQVGKQA